MTDPFWNHRVIKTVYKDGVEQFCVHEVYYNGDGTIHAHTQDPVPVCADSLTDLRSILEMMLKCLDKEVLVDGEIKFTDYHPLREDVPEK